jgi:uncharacterized protein
MPRCPTARSSNRRPLGVALALAFAAASCSSPPVPPAAPLVDLSGALDAAARARVERYLRFVREGRGIDYRVVLAEAGTESPEVEAERWFRELDVGTGNDGRGLLLWLDPAGRRARIEVGYALEGAVPDLSAAWILDGYLAPHARERAAGELAAGIEAAIEGLIDRVAVHADAGAIAADTAAPGSGGAGARTDLAAEPLPPGDLVLDLAPQPDPRAVRDLELEMMRAGHYYPTAVIYDEPWRRTRPRGRFRPERLREIARRFDRPYQVTVDGDHAAAYYLDAPDLGPTLLRREPDGWILDATAGARLVVYDDSNERWYLVDEPGSPYVALLREVYPMTRGRLQDGRAAWWIGD